MHSILTTVALAATGYDLSPLPEQRAHDPGPTAESVRKMFDAVEVPSLDLSDEAAAKKTLERVIASQKALADAGRSLADLAQNAENADADFAAALKALNEFRNAREVDGAATANSADATLRRYILDEDSAPKSGGVIKTQAGAPGEVLLRGFVDTEANEFVPGIFDDQLCDHPWVRKFRKLITERNIAYSLLGGTDRTRTPRCHARIRRHLVTAPAIFKKSRDWANVEKAFVDASGVGQEWIIDMGLPALLDNNPIIVGGLEQLFEVHDMVAGTEFIPAITTGLRPYKLAGSGGDDPAQFTKSSLTTAQRTISATGMTTYTQVDRDAEEDAILVAMPIIMTRLSESLRDGYEDCLLNGDTTASHQDTGIAAWNIRSRWGSSDLGGALDHRRTFLGLRALAADVSNTTDLASAQTYTGVVGTGAALASPGGINSMTALVMSRKWYMLKVLTMTEYLTYDLVSGLGTNEGGNVPAIAGMPIHISDFMDDELNASGIFDNSTKTKTGLVTVNRARYWVTRRMGDVIESDVDITRNIRRLVARNRKGFFAHDATRKDVHFGYNLSTS